MWRRWRGVYLIGGGTAGPNPSGNQCTNVPNVYWQSLGLPSKFGSASDWIGADDEFREWKPLSDLLRLETGDVAVFKVSASGPSGHVDLVLDGSKVPYAGLDQNWPIGAPVAEVWHMPTDLAGILRVR